MLSSIRAKLETLSERQEEIAALLADPQIIANQQEFRKLSIELSEITPVIDQYGQWQALQEELDETQSMLEDSDASIRKMAADEISPLREKLEQQSQSLMRALVAKDPNDDRNIFLEIRAGTGGDEAALFAGDLFRMYQNYATERKWKMEILSQSHGEHGGYREIISRVVGHGAYSRLKFESGVHRVQRVPATESQGRIHTSACTVAILAEADEIEEIEIATSDLRVDTFRASGAGGQHVNRTDSAVRLTHLPTGIVVECQDERSQHKNKARAMSVLKARLLDREQAEAKSAEDETRRSLVGSGDRSERIRTYNFPQGRVTDHRIELTLYKLVAVMEGDLDQLVDPLVSEHQAHDLARLSGE